MHQRIKPFFLRNSPLKGPFIIGLSGGPDSMALLDMLVCLRLPELRLVHINHGWREESDREEKQLAGYARSRGLFFFSKRLKLDLSKGNLEARSRVKRFEILLNLAREWEAQAILLGHQRDDVAETTLQRLFEGRHLLGLNSLKERAIIDGVAVWRPLLAFSKEELVSYCNERGLPYLVDPTNGDPRFLRARMRERLFPLIETEYGKRIGKNLKRLAEESQELELYLLERVSPHLSKVERCKDTVSLHFPHCPLVEAKFILRRLFECEGHFFSREQIDQMAEALINGSFSKRFTSATGEVSIHGGLLSLLNLRSN